MILSDEMWERIAPAPEPFEGIDRVEIERGLQQGEFRLFMAGDSIAITAPFGEVLRIGLAGGEIEDLLNVEKQLTEYALMKKYKFLEIIGRPGWERVLDGYERIAVMLRKEVGYGLH